MVRRGVLLGLGLALVASVALAQPGGPGGRGPGGPGGRGGFGFMASRGMLVAIPEVQTELGLSDEQKTKLEALQTETREAMRGAFTGDFREMTDEQRQQAREKMEAATKAAEEKLGTILDAKQKARLEQLRIQRVGVFALGMPEVVAALGITPEQEAAMEKVREAARGERGEGQGPPSEEARAAMRERREKMEADLMAVLTDAQKAKLAEMKGAEFKFPEVRGPGGGGPRGQGGPGGGGERRRPQRDN